jgi:hypothetical protein
VNARRDALKLIERGFAHGRRRLVGPEVGSRLPPVRMSEPASES